MNLLLKNMIDIKIMFKIPIMNVEDNNTLVLRIFRSAMILLMEIGRESDANVIKREYVGITME